VGGAAIAAPYNPVGRTDLQNCGWRLDMRFKMGYNGEKWALQRLFTQMSASVAELQGLIGGVFQLRNIK
jgi:hypothetical protein